MNVGQSGYGKISRGGQEVQRRMRRGFGGRDLKFKELLAALATSLHLSCVHVCVFVGVRGFFCRGKG